MISLSAMLAVTVTVSGLGTDGTANRNLIQAELNKARTLKEHLKVCIPAGTYPLSTTLFIYSNTELELSASTTFTRKGSTAHNMLFSRHLRADGELCDGDSSCKHGGYSQFSNITVSGGTWDAGEGEVDDGGIFHLCHGSGIVIRNATFKRASGHMLNLSGSRDILVENCTFRDAERYEGTDPNFWGDYEVGDEEAYKTVESIHLDVMNAGGEDGNYPLDDTPCANVTVGNCSFTNVFAAVGSHHYYPGIRLNGLNVQNCTFAELVGPAVFSVGVTNCVLQGCKANKVSEIVYASYSSGAVMNNEVANAERDGIFLYEETDYDVTCNLVMGAARNGINVYKSQTRIAANAITNSGNCAVLVSTRSKALLTGNVLQGAPQHGVCALDGSEVDVLETKIGGFLKDGIAVDGAARVGIRGNVIRGGEIGVYLTSVAHGEVCGNDLQGMTSFGIAATKGGVRFEDNLIRETGGFGLRLENCSGTSVERNALENIRTTAICVTGGAVGLSGNRIATPAEHGILATGGAEVNVSGNSIVQPQKTGVYLVGCQNSVVDANRIADVGAKAVWLQDSSDVKVSANEINVAAEEGVYCMRSTSVIAYNSVLGTGKIAIRIDGTETSKASAKVLKNIAESSLPTTWHDIRFVGYCRDSSAKGNIVLGKGLWVEPTSTDSVAIADSCSEEDAALLDYYDVSFDVGGGTPIPRILCRQGAVYRLPKSGGKGWRGSNGRLYDDEMLVFDLVPNGQTALMSVVK